MTRVNLKWMLIMHVLFLLYSVGSICSKLAAGKAFMSLHFLLLYSSVLVILLLYAVGWQQVIKHLPLSTAYANKAVTIVWGILWGCVFFRETITIGKLIGAAVVLIGVVLYTEADHGPER